jgi:hypothetical protein
MSLSMYQASAPVFVKALKAMVAILTKAKAHVEAKKIDEQAFIQSRLYPDMLSFPRQIQIAADGAKFAIARLAGVDAPSFPLQPSRLTARKTRISIWSAGVIRRCSKASPICWNKPIPTSIFT